MSNIRVASWPVSPTKSCSGATTGLAVSRLALPGWTATARIAKTIARRRVMTITLDTRPRSLVEFKLPAFSAQRIDLSQQRRGAVAHHYYATKPTASRNRARRASAPAIMDIVEHRRLLVFQTRRLRLVRASQADAEWLACRLDGVSRGRGTCIGLAEDSRFTVSWR